ncbi:DUF7344 domain-containing protein [Natronorubrum texcoconense]|uniref:DUF7344 domain-containing protein n=1 Tax=Natronorubrum texcoconense TaxID=1095776 RepID=A0A1G8ZP11_9EURY|nr:hypothetical protein [Natronorubrum texcoconense]SDK16781.1 hypothetical protein SAMN04515672_2398 [Natronorubrum texcoconense]
MSNPDVSDRSPRSREEVFDALANSTRREIIRIIHERSSDEIPKSDLAFRLAAVTTDTPLASVSDEDHQRALLGCEHKYLPALIDAGLVVESDDGSLATTDHWAFDDPEIEAVVTGRTNGDADLDALFGALADSRRRTILAVLANQYHPISTETLARDVAAREAGIAERDVSRERLETVLTSLVHVHLPRLNDADLVGYDSETSSVSYEGHPELRVEWLGDESDRVESATESTSGESVSDSSDDVRTLRGRESIVTAGQSLCERAEDELFMMFTTTGLLEEGCFRRVEDAIDRGVDVYVGSRDPRVREIVRDRAPEAVLWEPQQNWLDLPPNGESVGRLVFADREAVLLGTLGTPAADGEYDETALLGEGADNGFVVLMRQLLGSRLDQLDVPIETGQSEIPL